MNASPTSPASIEFFDEQTWIDMYAAAPPEFADTYGLDMQSWGSGTSFFCSKIPFVHFNCSLTLGLHGSLSAEQLAGWEALYRRRACSRVFAVLSPSAQIAALRALLAEAGFRPDGAWDRVYRNDATLGEPMASDRALRSEDVMQENAQHWADFVCAVYGLPNQPWLLALVGRQGWYHFLLKEEDSIIEARSCYLRDGHVWIGIDAPVPGMMTQDYEADYFLMHALVQKALSLGARHLIADIEMPDDHQQSPAYKYFQALGFTVPYRREIYAKELGPDAD